MTTYNAYHVSRTPFDGDFDITKIGATNDIGYSGRGFYFTPNLEYALNDIVPRSGDGFIRNFELHLNNPYEIHGPNEDIFSGEKDPSESEIEFQDRMTNIVKENGHDSVIRYTSNGDIEEITVFDPSKIKPISSWVNINDLR